jgi:hypothetical protein
MDKILVEFIKRMPDWGLMVATVIILILLTGVSVMMWIAVQRYMEAIGRENRIITLQDEVSKQKESAASSINSASQLQNVLMNARSFINTLNNNRTNPEEPDYIAFNQRIVEAIASDIKSYGGERHRCGLWIEDTQKGVLTLIHGSSGFPDHYINHRQLDINNSIAGRAFRKKQFLRINNVMEDSDWSSSESSLPYTAMICIPVGEWGIVTIDARKPLDENAQLIGELYTSILQGAMEDFLFSLSTKQKDEYRERVVVDEQ